MKSYSARYPSYKPRSVRKAQKKVKKNLIISVILIIIFGYFLISWGIPLLIGSLTVFNGLKPETEKVEVVAESDAIAPPVLNIPFEATNTATIRISGYAAPSSKVELYVNDDLKDNTETGGDGSFNFEGVGLSDGINYIYGKTLNDKGQKSLSSKTIKINFSSEKPKLEISEPTDGAEVKGGDKKVNVSGVTDPDNLISINGQTAIVNSDGSFSLAVGLNEGDNTVSILSTSPIGNIYKIDRRVKYTP